MKKSFKQRSELFFEFLIFGVVMGVTEDLIAIKVATDAQFSWHIFWIVILITIPFAILGELIVDKKLFLPKKYEGYRHKNRLEIFFEFLIFGIIVGITEDLIAIKIATDSQFSWNMLWIVTMVAIPFAVIGELIVDERKRLAEFFKKYIKLQNK